MEERSVVDTLKEMLTFFITIASLQLLFNFFAYLCIGLIKEIIFLFVKNKKKMKLYSKLDDIVIVSVGFIPILCLIIITGIFIFDKIYIYAIVPLTMVAIQLALIWRSIKNIWPTKREEEKIFDEKLL